MIVNPHSPNALLFFSFDLQAFNSHGSIWTCKISSAVSRNLRPRLDGSALEELRRIHEELLARPLPTLSSVIRWLNDLREVSVAMSEYDLMAYIRKSVNTRDSKAQKDYLHLIQTVHPGLAAYKDRLDQKLLEHPLRRKFPKRWNLMLKSRQNAVNLFREKNIPTGPRPALQPPTALDLRVAAALLLPACRHPYSGESMRCVLRSLGA